MADDPRITALKQKYRDEADRALAKTGAKLSREVLFEDLANQLYDELLDISDLADQASNIAKIFEDELSGRYAQPVPPILNAQASRPDTPRRMNGGQGNSPKPRAPLPDHLLTSPFRFVALNETVVKGADVSRAAPVSDGYSGRITVDWAVETPLLIGQPETTASPSKAAEPVRPLSMPGIGYVIPGATLRGMIRASAEIVAGARLAQLNRHHRYGLRDFTHPRVRPEDEDKSILSAKKVKAGWLRFDAKTGEASITPCKEWRRITHTMLRDILTLERESDEYIWRAKWLALDMEKRYKASGQRGFDFGSAPLRRFRITGSNTEVGYAELDAVNGEPGRLVFSNRSPASPSADQIRKAEARGGQSQPKKHEYVFFDTPYAEAFKVPPSDWERFWLINTKPARHNRKPDGSLAFLWPTLEKGNPVPVFYVEHSGILEFGLTRFFKIAHKYSIGDLLDRASAHKLPNQNTFQPDLVEALFGYVLEKSDFHPESAQSEARKGRVAFGFAKLVNAEDATEGPVIETIMGAPRASFAPFYLRGRYKDYSDPTARLAGRKRYIPRHRREDLADAPQNLVKSLNDLKPAGASPDMISRLHFLQHRTKGGELRFRSEIRLHNVSAVELGLLLWVLTHGGDPSKPYRHQIGRGKPFGAGQTRVDTLRLTLRANDAIAQARLIAAAPQGGDGWTTDGLDPKPFLRAFETYMAQNWSGWPKVTPVEQWLTAAKPAYGAAEAAKDRFRYPALPEFNAIRKAVKQDTKLAVPADSIPSSILEVNNGTADLQSKRS